MCFAQLLIGKVLIHHPAVFYFKEKTKLPKVNTNDGKRQKIRKVKIPSFGSFNNCTNVLLIMSMQ